MTRSEFSPSVRMQAFDRCKGFCEGKDCGAKLWPGKFAYDHIQADGLGGNPFSETTLRRIYVPMVKAQGAQP